MDTDTLFEFAVRGVRAQAEVNKLCNQPLARDKDPMTSHIAAEKMIKSGKLSRQQKSVLNLFTKYSQKHKDFTPLEVAGGNWSSLYFAIQRRKNELANKGLIKKNGKVRKGLDVWELVYRS